MKFTGFGIKNYRSIDKNGVFIHNLKKINVFIGKNNSGKSNILRFIKRVEEISNKISPRRFSLKDQHHRVDLMPILRFQFNFVDIISSQNAKSHQIDYDIDLHTFTKHFDKSFYTDYRTPVLQSFFEDYPTSASRVETIRRINDLIDSKVEEYLEFFNKVVYIPQFRQIMEKESDSDNEFDEFNGNNIIALMFNMQNPEIGDENAKLKFLKIQQFVRDLLNNQNVKIEIPHSKNTVIIEFDGTRLPLSNFGTGIHELVILSSAFVIFEKSVFCIEEPEIHLHPNLQRKFLRFLKNTNNYYFISTHSNVFLDYDEVLSVYHVELVNKKSIISYVNNSPDTNLILQDLGYKNSDILHSNGIIWVEGPSDRIYINKWLNLVNDKLIEGIHYSIMFYGGRLLSNVTYSYESVDTNLIPLLKINKNAFVVIDKDGQRISRKLNNTKERIIEEIGDNNFWVTQGREIENYLTETTISSWLSIEIGVEVNYIYDKHEKLENSISKVVPDSRIKYAGKKNHYSKIIVKHMQSSDLEILDLKARILQIIECIDEWNS